jgi:glutamine synthetase
MSARVLAQTRLNAVREATTRQPRRFEQQVDGKPVRVVSDYYGVNTFSFSAMKERLPKPIYKRLMTIIEEGGQLDHEVADAVAHSVKEWATERGATHFTHWFQPMTGSTAEKHDAFISVDDDGHAVERLSGAMLLQSEPDASSFPSGGMRSTFEARGYTGWDPSSPMFIMNTDNGATLCIPSVFIGYHGEALDKKTPLLRSMEALDKSARALLASVGAEGVKRVVATLGCEQEYFLVDRAYVALRPDLAISGRTVVGARPPKGQSMDDHYFGAIPARVQAFMQEVEFELYKLGVPAKTRHNEVAPSQFEIASIFCEANVAVDHNQLVMEILRKVAARHEFQVVMHEKPFAEVNGSGKHNNWSLATDGGENLLEPGLSPQKSLRFMTVLASVLLGVHRNAGLLRAAIASYRNDFRLGANEAPPAIISVFLGETLTRICDALVNGDAIADDAETAMIELGVGKLPSLIKDNTDRNRTSPFAFTGNKFEFRAVGSSQNPAVAITTLNAVVADAMDQVTAWINEAGGGEEAALAAVKRALTEADPVRFDGDGYSDEWVAEAEARGLKNLRKTPEALDELRRDEAAALFSRQGVYTPAELRARYNVWVEQYCTAIDIEVDLLSSFVDTLITPAALEERADLAASLSRLVELEARGLKVGYAIEQARLTAIGDLVEKMTAARDAMAAARADAHEDAHAYVKTVVPAMEEVRAMVDQLEESLSDARWPLPKYREMLFLQG